MGKQSRGKKKWLGRKLAHVNLKHGDLLHVVGATLLLRSSNIECALLCTCAKVSARIKTDERRVGKLSKIQSN